MLLFDYTCVLIQSTVILQFSGFGMQLCIAIMKLPAILGSLLNIAFSKSLQPNVCQIVVTRFFWSSFSKLEVTVICCKEDAGSCTKIYSPAVRIHLYECLLIDKKFYPPILYVVRSIPMCCSGKFHRKYFLCKIHPNDQTCIHITHVPMHKSY